MDINHGVFQSNHTVSPRKMFKNISVVSLLLGDDLTDYVTDQTMVSNGRLGITCFGASKITLD